MLAVFGRVGVIALSVPGLFLVGLFLDCKTMGYAAVAFILFFLLWVVLAAHCFVFVVLFVVFRVWGYCTFPVSGLFPMGLFLYCKTDGNAAVFVFCFLCGLS